MSIVNMRVYGLVTGNEAKHDEKFGRVVGKVIITDEHGKKMNFKVIGPRTSLEVQWGDKVCLDVESPVLKMSDYGNLYLECFELKVAKDEIIKSTPLPVAPKASV